MENLYINWLILISFVTSTILCWSYCPSNDMARGHDKQSHLLQKKLVNEHNQLRNHWDYHIRARKAAAASHATAKPQVDHNVHKKLPWLDIVKYNPIPYSNPWSLCPSLARSSYNQLINAGAKRNYEAQRAKTERIIQECLYTKASKTWTPPSNVIVRT